MHEYLHCLEMFMDNWQVKLHSTHQFKYDKHFDVTKNDKIK